MTKRPTTQFSRSRKDADSQSSGQIEAGLHARVRDMVSGMSEFLVSRLRSRYIDEGSPPRSYDWGEILATVIPTLLADAFESEFTGSSELARRRRAMLAHLLSTAELMSLSGKVIAASAPSPAPRVTGSERESGELTSEEAAKLLHVSRTHLNTLVDEGKLGQVRHTEGGHRRIPRAAVLAYRENTKKAQKKGLDRMVEASGRMRLYDEELEGLPVRPKGR